MTLAGFEVKKTSEIEVPYIKMVLYGPPGSWKTTYAGTFPKPLFIVFDNEEGVCSINDQEIDYVVPRGIAGTMKLLMALKKDINGYESIVIDHASAMYRIILRDYVETKYAGAEVNPKTQQDWGVILGHVLRMTELMRDLPCHTVLIANEEYRATGGDSMQMMPMLSGKAPNIVSSDFNTTLHMEQRKVKDKVLWVARTTESLSAKAKFRVSAKRRKEVAEGTPEYIVPTYENILKHMGFAPTEKGGEKTNGNE